MIKEQNSNIEVLRLRDNQKAVGLKKILTTTLSECENKYFELMDIYDIVIPVCCDRDYLEPEPYMFAIYGFNEIK